MSVAARWLMLVLFCALLLPPAPLQAARSKALHVVLLTPRNDAFWTLFAQITQAAADDLDVRLEWIPALNDAQKQLRDAQAVLQRQRDRPDVLIYKNYDGTAVPILELAEKQRVYSLIFEDGLTRSEAQRYGRPRQHFKYWLGEFVPDHLEAGYALTEALIALARERRGPDDTGPIQMGVIAGNMEETSSSDRIKGLQIALSQHSDVLVHDIQAGFWQEPVAYRKALRLLQAHPDLDLLWTANDTMPVGARRAATELGRQQLIIGGVGSTPPGAREVQQKRIQVSVGGNFLLGGFVMVLLYDYFSGYDFARESTMMRLGMYTFYPHNVGRYADALADNRWDQIDFSRFSRARNPALRKYNFGFQPILAQLEASAGK
ncbi:MAG: ABC transporter substrate-binding protein [Candidatus Sericytochromatia bacterium]|nr:ABC transporter substrate-binding protein [Candidatus Sericytochromatia bacterium]